MLIGGKNMKYKVMENINTGEKRMYNLSEDGRCMVGGCNWFLSNHKLVATDVTREQAMVLING